MTPTPQEFSVTMKFSSFEAFTAAMAKLHPTAAETIAVVQPKVEAAPPASPAPAAPPADPKDHVNLADPAPTTGRRRKKAAEAPAAAPATEPSAPVGTVATPATPAATNLFDTPAASTAAPPPSTPAPASTTAGAAAASAVKTIDDCRAALSAVNDKFGMPVAYSMLQDVGAERVSLIPENKRAEFVDACQKKVAA